MPPVGDVFPYVAVHIVRKNGFAVEIPISKLAKATQDRTLRIQVFRCLGPRVGESWEARICTRNGTVLGVEPITDCPDHLNRTDQFSKSSWSDNIFQITSSRFKTIEYSLDISPYTGDIGKEAAREHADRHAELQHQRELVFAVSEANKAFDSKNYELVIRLLSPFADELDKLMQARLAYARKKP